MAVRLSWRSFRFAAAISAVLTVPCAAQTTFSNPASITIADSGTPPTKASTYPSSIVVSGFSGQVIGKLTVTLFGFGHMFPSDVDILLVGPTGQSLVLLSDVGGTTSVSGLQLTLDDAAASNLPAAGPLVSGTFRPTNTVADDTFPAPASAPSSETSLTAFDGTDPDGTWSLYVVDDTPGGSGVLSGGWSLAITPAVQFSAGAVAIVDSPSPPTKASPYPSTIRVSGVGTTLDALAVTLSGLNHRSPDDIDVLLVGPSGANAIIMSDVGGNNWATNVTLTLDDLAGSSLPDAGQLVTGSFKPTNIDTTGPDTFPSPAPAPSGGSALSVFNGTDPNGTWSLYIVDDTATDGGSITGWTLTMQTSGAVSTTTTTLTTSTTTTSVTTTSTTTTTTKTTSTTTTTHTTTTTTHTTTTTTTPGGSTTTSVTATSTTATTASTTSTTAPPTSTTTWATTTTTSGSSTTTSSTAASTTTTMSAPPASSTTTIAPQAERTAPLAGTLLKIRDGANVGQRSLLVLSHDRTIALAHDLSGAADPTLHGARLRVWSEAGNVFDASYDLPAESWRVIGKSASRRGYRYDDPHGTAGPVRSVLVKDGVLLKITARAMLDVSLVTAPDPVGVTLTSGELVYCLSFGGTVKFSTARSYVAKNAPLAPCP